MTIALVATTLAASGALAASYATARTLRNLPVSTAAALWGVAHGGSARVHNGLLVVSGMHSGFGPRGGVTVGSVYLTKEVGDAATLRHEQHHAGQWAVLGPAAFGVSYVAAQWTGTALLHAGDAGSVFEMAAGLHDGGYDTPHAGLAHWLDHTLEPGQHPHLPARLRPMPAADDNRLAQRLHASATTPAAA
jgi:hypothetical protein